MFPLLPLVLLENSAADELSAVATTTLPAPKA